LRIVAVSQESQAHRRCLGAHSSRVTEAMLRSTHA
jgi:hypothetical protein